MARLITKIKKTRPYRFIVTYILNPIKKTWWSVFFRYIFSSKTVTVEGVEVYLNPNDDVVSRSCYFEKKWEEYEVKNIRENISPDSIAIDIGANIGIYTCILSEAVGKRGKVYAFEPSLENFHYLSKNSAYKENVIIENIALSDKCGEMMLYISPDNKGDHRIYQTIDEPKRDVIKVKTKTFVEYAKEKNIKIEQISVVKIDTQGAEPLVLKGMEEIISKMPKAVFFIEFWPYGMRGVGSNKNEFISFLSNYFVIRELDHIAKKISAPLSLNELEKLYDKLSSDTGIDYTILILTVQNSSSYPLN